MIDGRRGHGPANPCQPAAIGWCPRRLRPGHQPQNLRARHGAAETKLRVCGVARACVSVPGLGPEPPTRAMLRYSTTKRARNTRRRERDRAAASGVSPSGRTAPALVTGFRRARAGAAPAGPAQPVARWLELSGVLARPGAGTWWVWWAARCALVRDLRYAYIADIWLGHLGAGTVCKARLALFGHATIRSGPASR